MYKVLLINPSIREEGIDILRSRCELVVAPDGLPGTLSEYLKDDIQAVITRVERVDEAVLQHAQSLKIIGQNGVGVDNIDVESATRRGIAVINVPRANAWSVAEHVTMFVLALAKNLKRGDIAVRNGDTGYRDRELPFEVFGKSIFFIGFGNNARNTAKILQTIFSMKIYAYDKYVSEQDMQKLGVQKVSELDDGLGKTEFVSIHVPHTPETHLLVGKERLEKMRGSYLINCARGGVLDYDALYEALVSGVIRGAGLDVFEPEPPKVGTPLLLLDNVLLTPHYAGDTKEAKIRCATTLAEDVIRALDGNCPNGLVNKELRTHFR